MSKYIFKGKAYISGARQDKHRCDVVNFQFDVSQKLEVAKLNLMGTDLKTYEPVLLNITVEIADEQKGQTLQEENNIPKTGSKARRSRIS